jgi:hypothetical protein
VNQQAQRDPVRKLLLERVVLGLYPGTPLPVPPKEALEAILPLWEELREKERTRDRLILLFWGTLATLQTTACASCVSNRSGGELVSFFLMSALFTSPLPLFLLCRRRKALVSCCEIVRSVADQAMERECAGPLLDLLATHGLESTHFRIEDALARLLPRLTTDEAQGLTEKQRAALRHAITRRGARTELVVAGLLVLGTVQDEELHPLARKLFLYSKNEQVKEAAFEYFKAVNPDSQEDDWEEREDA